jgi:hypothetical protein
MGHSRSKVRRTLSHRTAEATEEGESPKVRRWWSTSMDDSCSEEYCTSRRVLGSRCDKRKRTSSSRRNYSQKGGTGGAPAMDEHGRRVRELLLTVAVLGDLRMEEGWL